MRVLVVNAGSSTLKLRAIGDTGDPEAEVDVDPWDGSEARKAFDAALEQAGPVDAVGHRVVHGGSELVGPTIVDEPVRSCIADLTPLAPLHQPRALAALDAATSALPEVPHVACFDTAFHASMPPAARTYALPRAWRDAWGLERFGFHGLSHSWAARRSVQLVDGRHSSRRIITCHLGAGASLCAVLDGKSVDTTMGFTPLEGLVMATRSGSVDPGLVLWLLTSAGLGVDEVSDGLELHGGLGGLSQTDGDMRNVLARRDAGDPAATLAFDVYIHRLRREIASMAAALGGIDVLTFTGGVGEHSAPVRRATVEGLAWLGLAIEESANESAKADADLSATDAHTRALVVRAREDLEIARQVRQLLGR
jgi:acetate kinase